MHCPGGNATDPIWSVLASSDGISSWTPLKLQHSNPNPLANHLWCIDFLTPPTPLIIPHRLPAFLESLMPLKNWCLIHARWSKSSLNVVLGLSRGPTERREIRYFYWPLKREIVIYVNSSQPVRESKECGSEWKPTDVCTLWPGQRDSSPKESPDMGRKKIEAK